MKSFFVILDLMIPKKIHYCWFGRNPKGELIERCIQSWVEQNPEYEVVEWNEENFDVDAHPFTKRMHAQKKWAFVADYARFVVLEKHGGWYFDTDMQIVKPLEGLSKYQVVLGEESAGVVSAGAIGARPEHPYIKACRQFYDKNPGVIITVPRAMTKVLGSFSSDTSIHILPPVAFYPYSQENIKSYDPRSLTNKTYGVHMWNYSWGHPLLRYFHRFPLYHKLKRIPGTQSLKEGVKKMLGMA